MKKSSLRAQKAKRTFWSVSVSSVFQWVKKEERKEWGRRTLLL